MALTVWHLGYPALAAKLIEQAGAEARQIPEPYAQVMVADNACMVAVVSKDLPGAKRYAEDVTNKSIQYGFIGEMAFARTIHAWADGHRGDSGGINRMRDALVEFAAAEGDLGGAWCRGLIAELCLKFGRNDEAIEMLEDAIGEISRTGEGFGESEIYRLRGEGELHRGDSNIGSAAKWFELAIEAARKRSARMAELRATSDLARLLAKRGKRDEARAMLADIYGKFTEGFESAALKDAKALIEELSG
jgi:tetratricopeptide (TPR) repeat protein